VLATVVKTYIAVWKAIFTAVGNFFKAIWNAIAAFFSAIWNTISGAVTSAGETLKAVFQAVGDFFRAIWDAIVGFFTAIWDILTNNSMTAGEKFKAIFQAVGDFFRAIWDAIVGFFTAIWDAITSAVTNAGETIKGIITAVGDFFRSIWEGIAGFFTGIWDGITGTVKGAADAIMGFLQPVFDFVSSVKNAIGGVIDGAKNLVGGAVDKVKGVLGFAKGTNNTPDTFMAGEQGPELITGAKGRKVFTASKTEGIVGAISDAIQTAQSVVSAARNALSRPQKSGGENIKVSVPQPDGGVVAAVKGIGGMITGAMKFVADKVTTLKDNANSSGLTDAVRAFGSDIAALAKSATASPSTVQEMVTSTTNRSVTQNNYFDSTFNGDRAGQKRSSEAMNKSATDATDELARALAFAR
jgi:phage-related protein